MAFTEDEVTALQLLLREELQAEIRPFRNEVNKRFDDIATQVYGLYRRDEKREQEHLSISEQMRRLEAQSQLIRSLGNGDRLGNYHALRC